VAGVVSATMTGDSGHNWRLLLSAFQVVKVTRQYHARRNTRRQEEHHAGSRNQRSDLGFAERTLTWQGDSLSSVING